MPFYRTATTTDAGVVAVRENRYVLKFLNAARPQPNWDMDMDGGRPLPPLIGNRRLPGCGDGGPSPSNNVIHKKRAC